MDLTSQSASHRTSLTSLNSQKSYTNMPVLHVGDKLPSVELFENDPTHSVNTEQLSKGKKVLLIGTNGAFTPNCNNAHVPGYIENFDKFKEKGIDEVICVAANDPYVMKAWGDDLHATGKIRMLSDTNGQFCKAAGVELDLQKELGNMRCKRFSMVVNDGVIEDLNIEPDGKGLTCTRAEDILEKL